MKPYLIHMKLYFFQIKLNGLSMKPYKSPEGRHDLLECRYDIPEAYMDRQ